MEELNQILDKLEKMYANGNMKAEEVIKEIIDLWNRYYKLSNELNIELDRAYDIYLNGENNAFIVDQEPIVKDVNVESVKEALIELKEYGYISKENVSVLLDYNVNEMRKNMKMLLIDIKTNSLNGLCELAQYITISPFENIGLDVTKNQAKDAFNYDLNHCFGTVTFPISDGTEIFFETYLIDTTYRQFFTISRCNEGIYHSNLDCKHPDPGYFMENSSFAKELLGNGYVKLNDETARLYGEGFSKAVNSDIENYYTSILNSSSDYKLPDFEKNDFDTNYFNDLVNFKKY